MSRGLAASIIIVLVVAGILTYYYFQNPGGPAGSTRQAGSSTTSPGYLSIIDDLNRTVRIPFPPKRIVTTIRITTSFILQFDVKDRLVGADSTEATNPFYTRLYPWLRNVTFVGTGKHNVNLEEIQRLKPDVVFAKDYQRSLLQSIEDSTPIVYLDLETPQSFIHDVKLVGRILGEEDRAEKLVEYYQGILGTVENRTGSLAEDMRPNVLFLYYRGPGDYNIPPTHWMQYNMIRLAGGKTLVVNGEGWTPINPEEIISFNPDIVFITSYRRNVSEAIQAFRSNPAFQSLRAIINNKVYPIPSDGEPWDMPTPKWVLCTLYMAVKMHPELYADINITEETITFYMTVYGASRETAIQLLPETIRS